MGIKHHIPLELGSYFSVAEARALGVSRRAVDATGLQRPYRGARLLTRPSPAEGSRAEAAASALEHRARQLRPVLAEHVFFTGPTAAALWGMPVPARTLKRLYVGVPFPSQTPERADVIAIRPQPHFLRIVDWNGLRMTDPPTTWAVLARYLERNDLVAALDFLLFIPRDPGGWHPERLTGPQFTKDEFVEVIGRGRWRHAPLLRQALELADTGSASHPETVFRLALLEADFPAPELNADIYDGPTWLANSDFVFREFKVCVEYQSAYHLEAGQYHSDRARLAALRRAGWIMVELTAEDVLHNPASGLDIVAEALRSRGWRAG